MTDAVLHLLQSEDLLQHLEQHCAAQPGRTGSSHVTAVRIVRQPATGISKGIAFVEFASKAAMRAALAANGQAFQKRELRITRIKPAAGLGGAPGKKGSQPGKLTRVDNAHAAERRMGKGAGAPSWQGTRTKGPGKVSCQLCKPPYSSCKQPVLPLLDASSPTTPAEQGGLCRWRSLPRQPASLV